MESPSGILQRLLAIPPKSADALLAGPAGMACRRMLALSNNLATAGFSQDARVIHERMLRLARALIANSESEIIGISPVAMAKARSIAKEAMAMGWTEFELWGCSSDYRLLSFAQLYIDGSEVSSVSNDCITVVTPSGSTQHIWRHNVY